MDLKTTQQLLARLCTDGALQKRFFAQPLDVAHELGIAPEDARALQALSGEHVAGFARSLRHKRINELRKALPATCRALGRRLEPLFNVFSDRREASFIAAASANASRRALADALAFAKFVSSPACTSRMPAASAAGEAPLSGFGAAPQRIADLARYEAIWLKFHRGRIWPLLAFFHSDPRELVHGGSAPSGEHVRLVAIWFRFAGRLRHLAW